MKSISNRTLAIILNLVVGLSLLASVLSADSAGTTNHIALGSRVFDLGVDPNTLDRGPEPNFIPLNRAKWLNEFISADPALRGAVVHIDQINRPAGDLWAQPGPASNFAISKGIPDSFKIEGYAVRAQSSSMRRFLYIPYESNLKFLVTCSNI